MQSQKRSILKMNKRGIVGMEVAERFIIALFTLGIIGFLVVIAVNSLNNANVATPGSTAANISTGVLNNISGGIGTFFGNSNTFFVLLAVVILVLIISLVLFAIRGFGGSAGGAVGGL